MGIVPRPGGRVADRAVRLTKAVVTFYRRRLPHLYHLNKPVFITWRLHGSLPSGRYFPPSTLDSGKAFVVFDRLLDEARTGPTYLREPSVAEMVVGALQHQSRVLNRYDLHAFVVMHNHVHLLVTPQVPLPLITRTIKSYTAKRANQILLRTGKFWQEESYDRFVRDANQFERIRAYIEMNPVRAGLVKEPGEYRWSSRAIL